jgi:hypothetical protein
MGRAVTLDNMAATYFGSRETLRRLTEEFGDQIDVRVVENRDRESLRAIPASQFASDPSVNIDQLREMAHALFADEFASLKDDHREVYEAFLKSGFRGR